MVRISLFLAGAVLLVSVVRVGNAGTTGPIGTYYLTNHNLNPTLDAIHGSALVHNSLIAPNEEGPIAIVRPFAGPTVQTTGSMIRFRGGEYVSAPNLAVAPDGNMWTNSFADNAYDGTSDGRNNYTVGYIGGNVIATGLQWSGTGTTIFNTGDAFYDWGITWDPTNHSLWIQNYVSGVITDYTMTGVPIVSFATPDGSFARSVGDTALAMDVDHTLWFERYTTGYLEHYAADGTYLGEIFFEGQNYWQGGEIAAVPEPGTIVMASVMLGLFGLGWARKRSRPARNPVPNN
jgi:hypothetical protein